MLETVKFKKTIKDENGNVIDTYHGSVVYNFPDSIYEEIERVGEATVLSMYCAQLEIRIQALCRAAEIGEAQNVVNQYVPGVSTRNRSSKRDLLAALNSLPEDVRKKIMDEIAQYKASKTA